MCTSGWYKSDRKSFGNNRCSFKILQLPEDPTLLARSGLLLSYAQLSRHNIRTLVPGGRITLIVMIGVASARYSQTNSVDLLKIIM